MSFLKEVVRDEYIQYPFYVVDELGKGVEVKQSVICSQSQIF